MKMARLFILLFVIMGIGSDSISQSYIIARIEVSNGDYSRQNTPVSISLDQLNIDYGSDLVLFETTDKKNIITPMQFEEDKQQLWWILSGPTKAKSVRTYELSKNILSIPKESCQKGLDVNNNGKILVISTSEKILLQYNIQPPALPEGIDSAYTRGAFIHPLYSPSGRMLTRIHPEDHYHHVGIWNPWTKTTFEGREVDFWNLAKKQGTVKCKDLTSIEKGSVFGGFKAVHEHIDFTAPGGEKTAIIEEWQIKVFTHNKNNNDLYMVEFISKLQCASDSPITLEKYRYGGGIGFRATEQWTKENSGVETSEGKTRKDADASRAKWCNVFGNIDSVKSGILFLNDPGNFDYPQPIRVWPEDAVNGKGYMYFQFCPIRDMDWKLSPGEIYFQKYRMIVYDGELNKDINERFWQDYANPPEITIEMNN